MPTDIILYTDGASRGNPGPAAIGAVLKDCKGKLLGTISETIGQATNNQAEYQAVIAALKQALRLGAQRVELRADSELVVRQLNGRYRVREAHLKPLYAEVKALAGRLKEFRVVHIDREENKDADRLANVALDHR